MIIVQTSESRSHCSPNDQPGSQVNSAWCAPRTAPSTTVASFHSANAAAKATPIAAAPIGPPSVRSCGPNAHSTTALTSGSSQIKNSSG